MRLGREGEEPLIGQALTMGWAVVVPDYEGPDSQWTAGTQAGHAVLDGIRAALRFGPAGLAGPSTPVGLWGYSGGAQATARATELQPGYAPDGRTSPAPPRAASPPTSSRWRAPSTAGSPAACSSAPRWG